jgi:hypothetical protein
MTGREKEKEEERGESLSLLKGPFADTDVAKTR